MAYYNDEQYIAEAVSSILNQTYKNLIFYCMGDLPENDKSKNIINNFEDDRILHYISDKRLCGHGIRNWGLELLFKEHPDIPYITFQDSDDYSDLYRIEKQVEFLDANPQYGMVGNRYIQINEAGIEILKADLPLSNYEIKSKHWTYNRICGASVMIRREILLNTGFYDLAFDESWDMELENRIMQITDVCNLSDYLYYYRLTARTTEANLIKKKLSFIPIIRYKVICKWLGVEFDKNKYKKAFWEL